MELYYPPTKNALQKTLDAQLDMGATASATLNNATGVQNKRGVVLIDRVDSSGNLKNTSDWEWIKFTGTSGSTITGLTRGVGGSTDQDHAVGAVVEFVQDITALQAILDILDGTTTGALLDTPTVTTPKIVTGLNDSGGNELVKVTATASAVNEFTVANAATGNSPTFSATGGDTNIGMNFKMKGTGVFKKPVVVHIPCFGPATNTATGDGKAMFEVPEELAGMNIAAVGAYVYTAGTTGTTDIQIRNVTQTADTLSTKITIDSTEVSSRTAAAPAVINTSEDDLTLGDRLAIDVDAVHTTPAVGLTVWFRAELP